MLQGVLALIISPFYIYKVTLLNTAIRLKLLPLKRYIIIMSVFTAEKSLAMLLIC